MTTRMAIGPIDLFLGMIERNAICYDGGLDPAETAVVLVSLHVDCAAFSAQHHSAASSMPSASIAHRALNFFSRTNMFGVMRWGHSSDPSPCVEEMIRGTSNAVRRTCSLSCSEGPAWFGFSLRRFRMVPHGPPLSPVVR